MASPLSADEFSRQSKDALDILVERGRVVLTASPGTGKTTRLPSLLLSALRKKGRTGAIWVLEPKRIAATLAAQFVAQHYAEAAGHTVGYHVRGEKKWHADTRILFLTYGMFLQRLTDEHALAGVDAILLDEFHERTWQQDASLSLAVAQQSRHGFGLGVLSATLDAQRVATLLQPALVCRISGPAHPVTVSYAPVARQQTLVSHTVACTLQALREHSTGDILIFLSGPKEIQSVARALQPLVQAQAVVRPLYAALNSAEQHAALEPAPPSLRKVIVATNIAESSVTIDGVRIVIDGGQSLQAFSDVASGVSSLRLGPISQASATQRAGRAGRQAPGACIRLYSSASFQQRPTFDLPEVSRLDLSEMALRMQALGLPLRESLFFEQCPTFHVQAAATTLRYLGALDAAGHLTPLGHELARLALHPRLARFAMSARDVGMATRDIALLIAILETPYAGDGLRPTPATSTESDILELLAVAPRIPSWTKAAREHEHTLKRLKSAAPDRRADDPLSTALFAGFGDQVARRLQSKKDARSSNRSLALAGGRSGILDDKSGVDKAPFLLCLGGRHDARLGATALCVTIAHAIDASRLLDGDPSLLDEEDETVATPSGRIVRVSKITYAGLVLLREENNETDPERRSVALSRLAWQRIEALPSFVQRFEQMTTRLRYCSDMQQLTNAAIESMDLQTMAKQAVKDLVGASKRYEDIDLDSLWFLIEQQLPSALRKKLSVLAPTHVTLKNGKRLAIQWQPHAPPYIQSYLQDFVEHQECIYLGDSSTRLIVHLWAPNRRPVQVTNDLASFWTVQYPTLKKQLSRRYPKHRWP